MVEFYDPIEKKKISYYISNVLTPKWDNIREGKIKKQDEDRVYIVDGRERFGKSLFTFQQAKYINPTFDVERICFTPDEFLKQIRNAPKGSVVVFDEAFRGLSSKASQSKVNKKIVQAMMEMGQRNLIVFIVLPTIFLLEMYAAVLRSNALFHIYKDKRGIRRFRIYSYKNKSLLFKLGKRKGFDYSQPRIKKNLRDRFYGVWSIDEQKYLKKKRESFRGIDLEQEEREMDKYYLERNLLIYILRKYTKLGEEGLAKELKKYGFTISGSQVGRICRQEQKNRIPHPA